MRILKWVKRGVVGNDGHLDDDRVRQVEDDYSLLALLATDTSARTVWWLVLVEGK